MSKAKQGQYPKEKIKNEGQPKGWKVIKMSIAEMNRELAKSYSEEDMVELSINCLVEHIKNVYNTLSSEIIFDKISAELEELYFENNDKLVNFLGVQSDWYTYLHGKLCDECAKIIQKLGWGYNARNLSPFPIDFKYDSEKENFIFYGYYDSKVYKEINLKTLCEKLNNKKYLVF